MNTASSAKDQDPIAAIGRLRKKLEYMSGEERVGTLVSAGILDENWNLRPPYDQVFGTEEEMRKAREKAKAAHR